MKDDAIAKNRETLETFYEAFAQRDHATMRECYAPHATFRDPAFDLTSGSQTADMWQMLCERGGDLQVSHELLEADAHSGKARWEARYTFSPTGRKVHNVVTSTFTLQDGKIVRQEDHFDFWRWARQALGVSGTLLGWTPYMAKKVRHEAMKSLQLYVLDRAKKAEA